MRPGRQSKDDFPDFPEPDLGRWIITITPSGFPMGPIGAITCSGGVFFFTFKQRIAHGRFSESLVALAALALVIGAIVWIAHHAAVPPTDKNDPPEPRSRSPNKGKA